MNTQNYFTHFAHFVRQCRNIIPPILYYDEARLLHILKKYAILPNIDNNLESQLECIKTFSDTFSLVESNIDLYKENRKILRFILLMYYRILKNYLQETGKQIDYSKASIIDIETYINQLSNDRKELLFLSVVNDLSDEVEISKEQNSIVTILKNVITESDLNSQIINELESYFSENEICSVLYPSCGSDISDIKYFMNVGNNIFSPHQVFIHVHNWDNIYNEIGNYFGNANIEQATYKTNFSDNSKISISKIFHEGNLYWFIFFSGTRNEDLVKQLVYNKVNIDSIISKNDGITSGMGHDGFSISTPLYICFYEFLQIKRIITEYGKDFISNLRESWKVDMVSGYINWLSNNFNQYDSQKIIARIQGKRYDQIIIENAEEYLIEEAHSLPLLNGNNLYREFYLLTIKSNNTSLNL